MVSAVGEGRGVRMNGGHHASRSDDMLMLSS